MRKPGFRGVIAVGVVALLSGYAEARDEAAVPSHQLSEFSLGTHLSGAPVDLSKLQGRVVAIEYWGTR